MQMAGYRSARLNTLDQIDQQGNLIISIRDRTIEWNFVPSPEKWERSSERRCDAMKRTWVITLVIVLLTLGVPTWFSMAGLIQMRDNAQLVRAVKKGELIRVEALLARGADPNSRDYDEPLDAPTQNQSVFYALQSNGMSSWRGQRRKTVLEYAVDKDRENIELVRTLVQHGAKVDQPDDGGMTPTMIASWNNATETLNLLLDKGANVNFADKNGVTALMFAAMNGSMEAVKLLRAHGADPTVKDGTGQTALDKAESLGKGQVAQLLKPVTKRK